MSAFMLRIQKIFGFVADDMRSMNGVKDCIFDCNLV